LGAEQKKLTIRQYLVAIKEKLTVKLVSDMELGKIKPGFYMLVRLASTFLDKDDQPITIWTASSTHRRDETYVSSSAVKS